MKGITVWMWLIAGVVVGMIMFVLFFQLMSYLTLSKYREDAKQSFDDLTSTINAMCESKSGIQSSKKIVFPDSVSMVYSTTDPKVFFEKNNRTYGKYACLKFQNEQFCEGLRCDLELSTIKNKPNVLGVVDTLLGRSSYHEYFVKLTKTECGISALNLGEYPSTTCGFKCEIKNLISCDNSAIGSLVNSRLFIYSDMTRINSSSDNSDDIIKLLTNVATYFGGKSILIVWEIDSLDPFLPAHLQINDSLNSHGFEVTSFRHTSPLTLDILKQYDQVWLYRPGWCDASSRAAACKGTIAWSAQEEQDISTYFNGGGSLFIVTDTGQGDKDIQFVINNILKIANQDGVVDNVCICGCGGKEVRTTTIIKHPITEGLSGIGVIASTKIECGS
jgi:hypothetical protein